MGSFIPGRYADVAPDGGPCIKPFAPMTEAERWQPEEFPKKETVINRTTRMDISNPVLSNPQEALRSADITFFPEHDLAFQQLLQAPQYYQESASQYSDSPGFAFVLVVPDLSISADAALTFVFENDAQASKRLDTYSNQSDIPPMYREDAVEVTKDGRTQWEVYQAVSATSDLTEALLTLLVDIENFSIEGVSIFGFIRPYLDENSDVQIEVNIMQTSIHEVKAKSISGSARFTGERYKNCHPGCAGWRGSYKRTLSVPFSISYKSTQRKDALALLQDSLDSVSQNIREVANDVDWLMDNVIEPVWNFGIAPTLCVAANYRAPVLAGVLFFVEDLGCYDKLSFDVDINDFIAKIKSPKITKSIRTALETELRNNLNNSVLSDAIKTPLASVFSTTARTRSPGTTTKAETELSSMSVWGENTFDEEEARNPGTYRPYEVETTIDVELSTQGTGDSCASELARPFAGARSPIYTPSFDDVPNDYSLNQLSDSEDKPMLSKPEVERLVAQADAAPLYNQEGPAAQVAAPFKLFAEGIYHHAKQGQLCQTIPVPVETPSGTVTIPTRLTPGGAPRVLRGSYTPIRPMTLQEATLILDARAAFLESIGEYAAFMPVVAHRSPDYDQAQVQLAHSAPVTAIQVDLPYNINGNSTGPGSSISINGTGLLSVFLEPATNCTNDNVEFEIKAIIFSQITGNVTVSSPFGATTEPVTPTNALGLAATNWINRDLYEDYYRPTYELTRRPEYACGLPTNDFIYSVQTLHHVDARIDLGFKATLVDDLGLSLHLSNFTIHENYLLGDANFYSGCSRGPISRTPSNHNQKHCIDWNAETNEVLPGARDYQAESEFINSLIETNEILHTQWAVAIQQQYGFGALQEFQSWLQAHVIVGPFYPQELNDLFVHSFLTTRNQAASNAQWQGQYSPGQ